MKSQTDIAVEARIVRSAEVGSGLANAEVPPGCSASLEILIKKNMR